jgi:anaphase-promoting complex subunit 10
MADAAPAADEAAAPPPPTTLADGLARGYYITPSLSDVDVSRVRCLNGDAVWVLSSARPSNGLPQLLSDDVSEFWQSDGAAPHVISLQFRRRTALSELAFFVDAGSDESYTPRTVSIRSGSLHHDLEELRKFDLPAPKGWVRVPLGDPDARGVNRYLRTWYLQLAVLQMQSNGRDMHIRCIKAMGPRGPAPAMAEGVAKALQAFRSSRVVRKPAVEAGGRTAALAAAAAAAAAQAPKQQAAQLA